MLLRLVILIVFTGSVNAAAAQTSSVADSATVPCSVGHFWTADVTDTIREWLLSNSVVTYVGPVVYHNTDGIGYGRQNTSGTLIGTMGTDMVTYNAPSWSSTPAGTMLGNNGSFNDHHYFMYSLTSLYYFNGVSFTQIYTTPPTYSFTVADISVDQNGLAWCFIGQAQTTTMLAINNAGQIVHTFPVSFDSQNAYGSFMLNGRVYVGLGNLNPVSPNTLLPIAIVGSVAVTGTPIPFVMPGGESLFDLAGCEPGDLVTGINSNEEPGAIRIFPNPSNGIFTIELSLASSYEIYSSLGELVIKQDKEITNAEINFGEQEEGVYFLRLQTASGVCVKRLVVVH